jgi:hypothetical protein
MFLSQLLLIFLVFIDFFQCNGMNLERFYIVFFILYISFIVLLMRIILLNFMFVSIVWVDRRVGFLLLLWFHWRYHRLVFGDIVVLVEIVKIFSDFLTQTHINWFRESYFDLLYARWFFQPLYIFTFQWRLSALEGGLRYVRSSFFQHLKFIPSRR